MKTKQITYAAVSIALIAVGYTLDKLISSALPISTALVTLVVVLTLCQICGKWWIAMLVTTAFGVISLLYCFILPNYSSPVFMNPLVSVVPRIAIGLTTYFSLLLFQRLFRRFERKFVSDILPRALSAIIGVLTNTLLVLSAMAIVDHGDVLAKIVGVMMSFNFVIEIVGSCLLVPVLSSAFTKIRGRTVVSEE